MKNSLHISPILLRMVLLVTCFMLVIMHNKSKAAGTSTILRSNVKATINFKSNTEKNELTVSLKSNREGIMKLFIFSTEGILINEVAVSARNITTIKGLKKGLYFYECFDNNERMKSGQIIIK